jgi:hypothetical protein
MNIRAMTPDDIDKIRELHYKFYSDLEFPDFLNGFLCGFVVTDERKNIIVAGGVQPIGEIILVTDKDKSRIQIGKALREAQNVSLFVGSKFGLNELVAFVKNDEYARHLVRHGFYPRSSVLSIKVPSWEKTHEVVTLQA